MIFSGDLDPTLKEVTDMLYWYSFTSRDALSNFEAGKHCVAVKIGHTVRKACLREYRLHTRKRTRLKYYDSELFLAYARAIEDIRKAAPIFLTKRNINIFAEKTLETSVFFMNMLDTHFSPDDTDDETEDSTAI
ncbi:hypothetical protein [Proteiniclasticum sp.]|uniref:hypothetical protein n=1 Tax=Proteiniclasticum sp. TaxID=2053595 RepID=UPI0028A1F735|nr:hypothetical protein [Proteiniclasticum sp.]